MQPDPMPLWAWIICFGIFFALGYVFKIVGHFTKKDMEEQLKKKGPDDA